ncbi:hypothetical protein Tc00.1047053428403.10, partial [Trypanosoma cruzi]
MSPPYTSITAKRPTCLGWADGAAVPSLAGTNLFVFFLSYSRFLLCSLIYVYVCVLTCCCCCYGFFSVKAKEREAIAHRENIYIYIYTRNKRSIDKNIRRKKKEALKKMAISEKKCLFIRVALYLLFIAAYAAGVVVFIIRFSNYWAAAGFF